MALAAREVAGTAERNLILDLDSAGVVDGLAVVAHARQLPMNFWHERILPRQEEPCGCVRRTVAALVLPSAILISVRANNELR